VFDSNGDLFISDSDNERVREVTPAGIITTVAGNGHLGYSGDNGPATGAQMFMPLGIALDGGGNLYLADYGNSVVRKVTYKSWSQTTTNVTADLNPAPVGGSINFTAGIATLGLISPTGMVTFMDGSVTLGTGALNASGQATYATSNIGIGQHSITAVYAGDGNNAGSISAVLMENINAADFTFSSSPASATVTAGQSGTFTLTVTPQGSFSSPISFSCTGLPTLAACQFSPGAVTPNSCTVTTALTITTMPRSAALALPSSGQRSSPLFAIWLALPSMVGIVLLPAPKRRKLASALFVCLVAGSCLFQVACGGTSNGGSGGGGGTGGTPVGTYTVSVIGGAGSSQHSTTVTLTIQ
jgi:hypothetical protein